MLPPVVRKATVLAALAFACAGTASEGSGPRSLGLALAETESPDRHWVTGGVTAPLAKEVATPLEAEPAIPVHALTSSEIAARLSSDPASLGAMSIGGPSRGALFNAEQVPEKNQLWQVVEPEFSWGTPEAIRSLEAAIARVHTEYPDSPPLYVGHLSARRGGYLRPHRSHQSGRDVDLGYFYLGGPGWYVRATAKTLDVPRTWALVKAFAADSNVEAIFMDRSVQRLLVDHAKALGETPSSLEKIFEGSHRGGEHLVRHEWGHLTHLHVRFKCPEAQNAGARAHAELVLSRQIPPRRYY